MATNILDVNVEMIKLAVINSFLFFVDGKNRISPIFNPKLLNVPMSAITDISVVAIPTSSVVNKRALITQKKKPKNACTAVLSIR